MSILYLTEQNSKLRKTGGRLVIEKDNVELREVKCFQLESVLLFGNVQVTTQALSEMLGQGISFALLSEDGKLKGILVAPLPKNAPLRVRQHRSLQDGDFCLKQARAAAIAKIRNGLELLKQADWDSGNKSPVLPNAADQDIRATDLEEACGRMKHYADCIERCTNLPSLRGFEGAAAVSYFNAFPRLLKGPNLFQGRSRRPARDPVNAVLSFGYVLLMTQLQSLLNAVGLDPFLGYLHQVTYSRASLVLDFLESYRAPVVDRLTVRLFNLKILKSEDFDGSPDAGFRLKPAAMKRFFVEWEGILGRLKVREAMRRQVESFLLVLKGEREIPEHFKFKAD